MEFDVHKHSIPAASLGGDMNCLCLDHTVGEILGLLGHLAHGDDLIYFPTQKLLFRVEEHMLEGWVAHYNSSFDIEGNNSDRAVPDEGVQVRGPLSGGLLCLFLFRDIRHQDIEGDEPAVCVRAANGGTLYPSNEVVLPDDPDVKDRGIFPTEQFSTRVRAAGRSSS